jgi:Carboxypeptidase regulatory-like domain
MIMFSVTLAAVGGFAQEQEPTTRGAIQGTVIDSSGAGVAGAIVSGDSKATDTQVTVKTDKDGKYDTGPQPAGVYAIRIEARNFNISRFTVTVRDGQITNGDHKLQSIDPGEPPLDSRVDPRDLVELPIDGRDALNLPQFVPGVIIQSGGTLDATKSGNFAVSTNKVSGAATRYALDGVDLTDQTKGDILQNAAQSSVGSVVVTRNSPDISVGPASTGAVVLTTGTGSDLLHGEGYGLFRYDSIGFASSPGGQDLSFQRQDFGGRVGGRLIKDRAFFFVSAEHARQDARQSVVWPAPFQSFTGSFSSPYRNTSASGKLDWNFSKTAHAFYRFSYNLNKSVDNFGDDYSVYQNTGNAPSHAGGFNLEHGDYIHRFRIGYLRYQDSLQSAAGGTNPLAASLPVNLAFSDLAGGRAQFGPSRFAPQEVFQQNLEGRYDASRTSGDHTLHFGGSVNWIKGGGYNQPFGLAPQVTTAWSSGIDPNPLDYPVLFATLGNGQRFPTERSGFGLPHGGQVDTRVQGYIGDSWRLRQNLTLTLGVHYLRDSGLVDSDLARIPCSAANPAIPVVYRPCTGNQTGLLDEFSPSVGGYGLPVSEPNYNFGPQVGFAWDPFRNGRTVVRGGGGVFYDTSLFSNVGLDRPVRLSQGLYAATEVLTCAPGAAAGTVAVYFPTADGLPTAIRSIDGKDLATEVCGQPVGAAGAAVADLASAYQAAVALAGAARNPNFVGNTLALSVPANGLAAFAPNYLTPRSYQMNVGFERQIRSGGVLTLDYLRNVSQRFTLVYDTNHVGDANYVYKNANGLPTPALNAITNTITQKAPGCLPAVPLSPGAITQSAISCYISSVPNPNINDFAANGLDSGVAFLGGMSATVGVPVAAGVDPRDFGAAFPGVNALVGQGEFQSSVGHSVYDGLHFSLKQYIPREFFIFRSADLQISYTLSKFVTDGGDNPTQTTVAYDFGAPSSFKGPSPLDRRHQVSFGLVMASRWGGRLSLLGRYASPAALLPSLLVKTGNPQATPGEIFRSDFTGDGTPGDLFPVKNPGPFDATSPGDLVSAIATYNGTQAGVLTPAGTALVNANLFTRSQLVSLRGTTPYLVVPPMGQFSNPWFKSLDAAISWPLKVRERFTVEPTARVLNVFNFRNFQPVSGQLTYYFPGPGQPSTGGAGSANGTPAGNARDILRVGPGSTVYNYGAPRQMEFGLKLTF